MATAYETPYPKFQAFDSNGAPLSGGKLYSYENGTTTNKNTYTDSTGTVANTNPVILDSRGEADVWLDGTYTLVLKDSADVQIWSVDNVVGTGSTADVGDQWIISGLTPTYVSATSFTLSGDQTSDFEVGRRIKTTNSGGTVYSTITATSYSDPNTTVTIANDESASLDSGLSAVSLGILTFRFTAAPNFELSITHDIASDADYTLTALQNLHKRIIITDTGTNLTQARNIVVSTTQRQFIAQNDTAYTLTFKTSGGTGIEVVAGSHMHLLCDGTNVEIAFEQTVLDTVQSPTSGTTVNFTPPAWAKKVTLSLDQIAASTNLILRLGTGGTPDTTGYINIYSRISDQPAYFVASQTTAFIAMTVSSGSPVISGSLELTLLDSSTNTWILSGLMIQDNGTFHYTQQTAGSKSLSGALDIVELSTTAFSAGKVNAIYQ